MQPQVEADRLHSNISEIYWFAFTTSPLSPAVIVPLRGSPESPRATVKISACVLDYKLGVTSAWWNGGQIR